jgi:hypothetical protein
MSPCERKLDAMRLMIASGPTHMQDKNNQRILTALMYPLVTPFLVLTLGLSGVAFWPASATSSEFVTLGKDAWGFHSELCGSRIEIQPPATIDAEVFIELVGPQNAQKINSLKFTIVRSIGLRNACAVFYKELRYLIYDPVWARTVTPEHYLVLGHEAGHHFCSHTIDTFRYEVWAAELEADRFSGASIRQFEVYHAKDFIGSVLEAASRMYPTEGSHLHPPSNIRLAAIKLGYEQGSPCGDLTRTQEPGFSSGPR